MVVRGEDSSQFSAAMVFPGGVVDPEDAGDEWLERCDGAADLTVAERARRIAGFRELYEETGILLAGSAAGVPLPAPPTPFADALRACGGRLDLSAMVPFAHWITPHGPPKRYDVHFRLCSLTTEAEAICDGRETTEALWLRPADAVALGDSGSRNLLFPTRCQLDLLMASGSVAEAVASAEARRIVSVTPSMERREDGIRLSIPPESGYPRCEMFLREPARG